MTGLGSRQGLDGRQGLRWPPRRPGERQQGGRVLRACAKPRNPRHFESIEGGRVYQTRLVTIQSVKAIYSGKTTVSDTFWRPGGV